MRSTPQTAKPSVVFSGVKALHAEQKQLWYAHTEKGFYVSPHGSHTSRKKDGVRHLKWGEFRWLFDDEHTAHGCRGGRGLLTTDHGRRYRSNTSLRVNTSSAVTSR